MRPTSLTIAVVARSSLLTPRQREALLMLREAAEAAGNEKLDVWQFAVEIDQLRALGLSHTDLRCLLCWNYLAHGRERTSAKTRSRLFQPLGNLVLPPRTCFVLTAWGSEAASANGAEKRFRDATIEAEPAVAPHPVPEVPRWDGEACQLWWEKRLIKAFHRPAANQELILAALQEEGWPPKIDDPLPPWAGIDPKVRLRDTIKALNRHHLHRILHFGGDGKGEGIQWTLVKPG